MLMRTSILPVLYLFYPISPWVSAFTPNSPTPQNAPDRVFLFPNNKSTVLRMSQRSNKEQREQDIKQKIMQLKRQGRIKKKNSFESDDHDLEPLDDGEDEQQQLLASKNDSSQDQKRSSSYDQYVDKIASRLGNRGKLLGISARKRQDGLNTSKVSETGGVGKRKAILGRSSDNIPSTPSSEKRKVREIEELSTSEFDTDEIDEASYDGNIEDEQELNLVQLVEMKLQEKMQRDAMKRDQQLLAQSLKSESPMAVESTLEEQTDNIKKTSVVSSGNNDTHLTNNDMEKPSFNRTTSGVGGAWSKEEATEVETYRPSRGSWGYFPRPKDISRAYGGGREVGASVRSTIEDEQRKKESEENTLELLRSYREKAGIDVQSEKDHAQEIEEALALGQKAMQRGVYNVAVSALEKVTKYCSTNSKVGSQVFLELAMAYEAIGRTQEAISVYSALSTSRMENIKFNAKRLLYGIEAMQFMREEAKSAEFSRKKVSQTFIDTTGLANIADNFEVRYNTAYVDLEKGGGFYRKLTENVVRSTREARQILLKATGSGEIDRIRIVQALRSMSRSFDDALKEEASKRDIQKMEPIAVINGVPIISTIANTDDSASRMEQFFVPSAEQMIENLDGEWKLQLMADKKGDGVSFYNTTLAWQLIDSEDMSYQTYGPIGFFTVSQKGTYNVEENQRVFSRSNLQSAGSGAFLAGFLDSGGLSGAVASTNVLQQIIAVDSELLITRIARPKNVENDNVKDYFSVWRRVQKGSYSRL